MLMCWQGSTINDLMLFDNWRSDTRTIVQYWLRVVSISQNECFLTVTLHLLPLPPTQTLTHKILWFQCSVKSHGHELTLHHRAHLYSAREAGHLLQTVDQTSIPPQKKEMVRTIEIKYGEFRWEFMNFIRNLVFYRRHRCLPRRQAIATEFSFAIFWILW